MALTKAKVKRLRFRPVEGREEIFALFRRVAMEIVLHKNANPTNPAKGG